MQLAWQVADPDQATTLGKDPDCVSSAHLGQLMGN